MRDRKRNKKNLDAYFPPFLFVEHRPPPARRHVGRERWWVRMPVHIWLRTQKLSSSLTRTWRNFPKEGRSPMCTQSWKINVIYFFSGLALSFFCVDKKKGMEIKRLGKIRKKKRGFSWFNCYHPISRFTIESNKVNSENCWPSSCCHTGRNANLYWAVFPSVVAADDTSDRDGSVNWASVISRRGRPIKLLLSLFCQSHLSWDFHLQGFFVHPSPCPSPAVWHKSRIVAL